MTPDLEKVKQCPACGSSNVIYREEDDQIVCNDCGEVFSELPPKGNPKLDTTLNMMTSGYDSQRSGREDSTENEETVRVIIEAVPGNAEHVITELYALGKVESSYGDMIYLRLS